MKILVVTQYFWPEEFRINDICKGLKEAGHEVEVLTGLPNYPRGKIYEGYSIFDAKEKYYEGIRIRRVPIVPRGEDSKVKLALNYLSFMITGSIGIIPLLPKKYDRIFVFQLSPITSAIPALVLSRIKKIPSYLYIQDLWPETLYSIVNINNKTVRKVMKKICIDIYDGFDKLLITSKGFKDVLVKEKIKESKLEYFPQWAEDFYSKKESKKENSKEFIITFAGNIGKAQSVDTIIKAANLSKDNKNIKWQILGHGSEFNNIKEMVENYNLEDTVKLLGRRPSKEMPKYFSKSDVLIVTLKKDEILNITLPAKVQSYMASGKPILAATGGEGNNIINDSNCGLACEAEDYKGLYENAMKLYNLSQKERETLGENGKRYFEDNFTRNKLLKKLQIIME